MIDQYNSVYNILLKHMVINKFGLFFFKYDPKVGLKELI